MICARDYYGSKKAAGGSIPASEHSTITSWGVDGECDAMRNMLESYPEGLVACVSDSFDIWRACKDYWGDKLKDLIKGRITDTKFGRLVVRPDSGDPAETCCSILKILLEQFKEDVTETKTGLESLRTLSFATRLLPSAMLFGASREVGCAVRDIGKEPGDNIAFGSGGALLQKLNRDTFKCAFKCAEITINGESRDVFKDPITDKGKASKKGRLTLQLASETTGFSDSDKYKPRSDANPVPGGTGFLQLGDWRKMHILEYVGHSEKLFLFPFVVCRMEAFLWTTRWNRFEPKQTSRMDLSVEVPREVDALGVGNWGRLLESEPATYAAEACRACVAVLPFLLDSEKNAAASALVQVLRRTARARKAR
eukprot:g22793.t1